MKIGDLKFGLVHGHTVIPWGDINSLGMVQRQMDVDVLISGHTHEFRTYAYEDKLLINPGSATGAYSSKESSTTPSFCLFDVDASKVRQVYRHFLLALRRKGFLVYSLLYLLSNFLSLRPPYIPTS